MQQHRCWDRAGGQDNSPGALEAAARLQWKRGSRGEGAKTTPAALGGLGCRVGVGRGRCSFSKNCIPPTVIYFVDFKLTLASSFSALLQ